MSQSLPIYWAIKADLDDPSSLLTFSPKLMAWSHNTWLLDLSPCLSYWQGWAQVKKMDLEFMLQKALRALLQRPGEIPTFSAVFADHPWQALLLASLMAERNLHGFLSTNHQLTKSLYQEVSWSLWFEQAQAIAPHFEAVKAEHFNRAVYQRRLKQMQAAIKKLRIYKIAIMAKAQGLAMQRRFGSSLALLWDWSAGEFPWINWKLPIKPAVSRPLDYPVWLWEHIEPLLQEDCNRLCQQPVWLSNERVIKIHWKLVLEDMSERTVEINFRYPHHLHQELGEQKTMLLQAKYAFESQFFNVDEEEDCQRPIISWQLTVEERLSSMQIVRDLFGFSDSNLDRLFKLENQLPVKLNRFDLQKDWLPEDSYTEVARDHEDKHEDSPWFRAARTRPLYVYKTPQLLKHKNVSSAFVFLERISAKWWLKPRLEHDYRDYYCMFDYTGRRLWVYKDVRGQWYTHGFFA